MTMFPAPGLFRLVTNPPSALLQNCLHLTTRTNHRSHLNCRFTSPPEQRISSDGVIPFKWGELNLHNPFILYSCKMRSYLSVFDDVFCNFFFRTSSNIRFPSVNFHPLFCFPFQPAVISFTRHRQYPPPLERAQEAKELWGKLGSCDEGHWVLTIAVWSWGNTVMAAWNRLLRGCKFVIFILGSKVAAKFKLTNIRLPTFFNLLSSWLPQSGVGAKYNLHQVIQWRV